MQSIQQTHFCCESLPNRPSYYHSQNSGLSQAFDTRTKTCCFSVPLNNASFMRFSSDAFLPVMVNKSYFIPDQVPFSIFIVQGTNPLIHLFLSPRRTFYTSLVKVWRIRLHFKHIPWRGSRVTLERFHCVWTTFLSLLPSFKFYTSAAA